MVYHLVYIEVYTLVYIYAMPNTLQRRYKGVNKALVAKRFRVTRQRIANLLRKNPSTPTAREKTILLALEREREKGSKAA